MSAHSKKLSQDFQIIQETVKSSNIIRLYQKASFLGKGGFARVYEFINIESKKTYAGKVIEKTSLCKSRVRQKLMTEIKIHKSLNHPNIVKFEHFFEDSENVYILLELCQNHSLSELIRRRKRLTEIEVQYYLSQIIDSLIYLHGQKVIHRDIKLGNLLLNEKMQIKLADFGLACKLEFEGERKSTICGTPNYIAPEIIAGGSGHSYEVDVWSLGVLAFTMLAGRPPFETSDVKDTYRRIKSNAYSFPDHVELSYEAKELIIKILVLDPKERPNLHQIKDLRFFTKNSIPAMIPLSSLAIAPTSNFVKQFQQKTCADLELAGAENLIFDKEEAKREGTLNANRRAAGENEGLICKRDSNLNGNCGRVESIKEHIENKDGAKNNVENKDCAKNNLKRTEVDGGLKAEAAFEKENIENIGNIGKGNNELGLKPAATSRKSFVCSCYSKSEYGPRVFVKKWIDYSEKYGVAYSLNNKNIGIYFNDYSRLISDVKGTCFKYYDRNIGDLQFSQQELPSDLKKKVSVLDHFRKYLQDEQDPSLNLEPIVKKVIFTQHATLFRLTNQLVQIRFLDKSEVFINGETKYVVYINKHQECKEYPLGNVFDSNCADISKRMRYIKEVLTTSTQVP